MSRTMEPTEAVTYGVSTRGQREAWRVRHFADSSEAGVNARRRALVAGQVAEAYAAGWLNGNADRLSTAQRDAGVHASWVFGEEVEHASWLFDTERTFFKDGYGNAWEKFRAAQGFTV